MNKHYLFGIILLMSHTALGGGQLAPEERPAVLERQDLIQLAPPEERKMQLPPEERPPSKPIPPDEPAPSYQAPPEEGPPASSDKPTPPLYD